MFVVAQEDLNKFYPHELTQGTHFSAHHDGFLKHTETSKRNPVMTYVVSFHRSGIITVLLDYITLNSGLIWNWLKIIQTYEHVWAHVNTETWLKLRIVTRRQTRPVYICSMLEIVLRDVDFMLINYTQLPNALFCLASLQPGSWPRCCWVQWVRTATGSHWDPHRLPGYTERALQPPKTPSTPRLNRHSVTAPTGLPPGVFRAEKDGSVLLLSLSQYDQYEDGVFRMVCPAAPSASLQKSGQVLAMVSRSCRCHSVALLLFSHFPGILQP